MSEEKEQTSSLTTNDFLSKLSERVSGYTANLLLESALLKAGIMTNSDKELNKEEAKNLCLQLINNGGPAFAVGKSIYKEYLQ